MAKSVNAILLVLAAVLLVPFASYAAGLGTLTVRSALGQPLDAEIEVVALQPGEDLQVRLASRETHRDAGVDLSPALQGARFTIERRDGKTVIRVRTTLPVNDPFLSVLVEVQLPTGRLARQYTILVDPVEFRTAATLAPAAPSAAAAPAPAAAPSAATSTPPRASTRPVTATPRPAPAPAAPVAAAVQPAPVAPAATPAPAATAPLAAAPVQPAVIAPAPQPAAAAPAPAPVRQPIAVAPAPQPVAAAPTPAPAPQAIVAAPTPAYAPQPIAASPAPAPAQPVSVAPPAAAVEAPTPPAVAVAAPAPVPAAPQTPALASVTPTTVAAAPAVSTPPATATQSAAAPTVQPASAVSTAPTQQNADVSDTYRIKRGDTLGAIARKWRPEGVTQQQMLVGLYQTNRPAFIRNNINLIRAGATLFIPGRDDVMAISAVDAARQVRTHMAAFSRYRDTAISAGSGSGRISQAQREVIGRRIGVKRSTRAM